MQSRGRSMPLGFREERKGGVMKLRQLGESTCPTMLWMFLFFLSGGFLITAPVSGAELYVCKTGCTYDTIKAAMMAAQSGEPGDTIIVGTPGQTEVYHESTILMKPGVTLRSAGDDETLAYSTTDLEFPATVRKRALETIIEGPGNERIIMFPDDSDGNTILDGFTIRNRSDATAGTDLFLVDIGGGTPVVSWNIVTDNQGEGFSGGIGAKALASTPAGPSIHHNVIHDVNGPGVGCGPKSHALISNNTIFDCNTEDGAGIGLYGDTSPTIEGNTLFHNQMAGIGSPGDVSQVADRGLEADVEELSITILGNTICRNAMAGIGLGRVSGNIGTIDVAIGDGTDANANRIYENDAAGISIVGLTEAIIDHNHIHHNGGATIAQKGQIGAGIRLVSLTRATIKNNTADQGDTLPNDQGIQYNADAGILLEGVANSNIDNNDLHWNGVLGQGGRGAGIRLNGVTVAATVSNNRISYNNRAGVRISELVGEATFELNYIHHNGRAGILAGRNLGNTDGVSGGPWVNDDYPMSGTLNINGNKIYSNDRAGIESNKVLNLNLGTVTVGDDVKGNEIYLNENTGIRIYPGTNATISGALIGLTISENTDDPGANGESGIWIMPNADVTIENCEIAYNATGGLYIESGATVDIEECLIHHNLKGGITSDGDLLTVTLSYVYQNGNGGIQINSSSAGYTSVISANEIYGNTLGGIAIQGPCTVDITDNNVYGNGRGGIHTGDPDSGVDQGREQGSFQADPGTAGLQILRNKVHNNLRTGIDVRHASGSISNNLVYQNAMAGIRFCDWIDQIRNNTVVANGRGGIVFDNLAGDVNAAPAGSASGSDPDGPPTIMNNICRRNSMTGIWYTIDGACPTNASRNYNLLSQNMGLLGECDDPTTVCARRNLGYCPGSDQEIFDDPLFVLEDPTPPTEPDYHLSPASPAKGAGDDLNDLGAYGGDEPIIW
jgi:hypothetical protein